MSVQSSTHYESKTADHLEQAGPITTTRVGMEGTATHSQTPLQVDQAIYRTAAEKGIEVLRHHHTTPCPRRSSKGKVQPIPAAPLQVNHVLMSRFMSQQKATKR